MDVTASPTRVISIQTYARVSIWVADGSTFRPIQESGVSLAYFEVPSTGFSANGALYAFVWTDHKDLFRQDAEGNELFPIHSDMRRYYVRTITAALSG